MQTITLQIKDEKVDEFLVILNNLKDDLIDTFTLTNSDEKEYIKSEQFLKDKTKLEQTLQDIEDGKAILYTQEEFQNKMNYFINDLRNKYANN